MIGWIWVAGERVQDAVSQFVAQDIQFGNRVFVDNLNQQLVPDCVWRTVNFRVMKAHVSNPSSGIPLKASIIKSGSVSSISEADEILWFDAQDPIQLEKALFSTVTDHEPDKLLQLFNVRGLNTHILQFLLTTSYPNHESRFQHEDDVIKDADELLGPSVEHINLIQLACLLGEEDIAIEILSFVKRVTEDIEARKLLYEFMGRIWGNGNTVLHLASFMGMSALVKILLELGAAKGKLNERKYKPVDCTNDDATLIAFETVEEFEDDRAKRLDALHNKMNFLDLPKSPSGSISEKIISTHSKSNSFEIPTDKPAHARARSQTVAASNIKPQPKSKLKTTFSEELYKSSKRKTVSFDPVTMLMYICQYASSVDNATEALRSCLQTKTPTLDVNQIVSPHQWLTPLHIACTHGNLEIAKVLLLEAGAKVNVYDIEGWTPLHCAAAEGHVEILLLLGRCQGRPGEAPTNPDWIYVPDGPIDLLPENEDGDLPMDIALDNSKQAIEQLFDELIAKYPPTKGLDPKNEENVDEAQEPANEALCHNNSIKLKRQNKNDNAVSLNVENEKEVELCVSIPKVDEVKREPALDSPSRKSRLEKNPVMEGSSGNFMWLTDEKKSLDNLDGRVMRKSSKSKAEDESSKNENEKPLSVKDRIKRLEAAI